MKKILFLHNGAKQYSPSRVDLRFAAAGFDVDYQWAAQGEFPARLDIYAGVWISGSPNGAYEDIDWIHREHEVIQELAKHLVPMYGSCFGHQILASALCGRDTVFKRSFCEVGYRWITLHHPPQGDPILRGLKNRTYMYVYHNDDVKADHPDMCILGSNEVCPNHIWRFRDLPFWGIQGHPELTKEQALQSFKESREKLIRDGADLDELYRTVDEQAEARAFVTNFIDFCAGKNP